MEKIDQQKNRRLNISPKTGWNTLIQVVLSIQNSFNKAIYKIKSEETNVLTIQNIKLRMPLEIFEDGVDDSRTMVRFPAYSREMDSKFNDKHLAEITINYDAYNF